MSYSVEVNYTIKCPKSNNKFISPKVMELHQEGISGQMKCPDCGEVHTAVRSEHSVRWKN